MPFSKTQLRMGTAVELEHTASKTVARKIAKDHLAENPKYYTYLNKMEKKMAMDARKARRKKNR